MNLSPGAKWGIGLFLLAIIVTIIVVATAGSKVSPTTEVSPNGTVSQYDIKGNNIYITASGYSSIIGLILYRDNSNTNFLILPGNDNDVVLYTFNTVSNMVVPIPQSSDSSGYRTRFEMSNANLSVFADSIVINHPNGTLTGQLIVKTGDIYTVKFGDGFYSHVTYNFGTKSITFEVLSLSASVHINHRTTVSSFNPLSSTPLTVTLELFGKTYTFPTRVLSKNSSGNKYILYATSADIPRDAMEMFSAYSEDGPTEGIESFDNLYGTDRVYMVYSTISNSIIYADTNIIPKTFTIDYTKNYITVDTGTLIALSGYLTALDRIVFENEYGHTFMIYKNWGGDNRIRITYNNYDSNMKSNYIWGSIIPFYDPFDYKKAPPCGNGVGSYLSGYRNCYLGDKIVDPSLCGKDDNGNSSPFIYNQFRDSCTKYVKSIKIQRYAYVGNGFNMPAHYRHVHISEVELFDYFGDKIPSSMVTITASSFEGVDKPSNIMDGDPNTHWHSNIAANNNGMYFHWIKIAFDKPYPVTKMTMTLPTNLPQDRIMGCGIDFLDSDDVPIMQTYMIISVKPRYEFGIDYPAKIAYDAIHPFTRLLNP